MDAGGGRQARAPRHETRERCLADVRGFRRRYHFAPYFDVTNYGEDQWLRLWFLGGPSRPTKQKFYQDDRHASLDQYWVMLADMWRTFATVLGRNSDIVIRLGATRIGPKKLVSGLEGVARVANRRIRLVAHDVSEIKKR